jgi:small subunit ribosomal protein S27Ae
MGVKKPKKTGKKTPKNKPTSKKYSKYTTEGDKIKRSPQCPRCGPGIFLSVSQGKKYCGKCHYTEFEGKKPSEEKSKDEKKE